MNRIKMYLNSLGKGTRVLIISLAVIFGSAGLVQAATTISTNILTGGTLGALGISTFGATASTTVSAAGVLTTPSLFALAGSIGATASTTISAAGVVTRYYQEHVGKHNGSVRHPDCGRKPHTLECSSSYLNRDGRMRHNDSNQLIDEDTPYVQHIRYNHDHQWRNGAGCCRLGLRVFLPIVA